MSGLLVVNIGHPSIRTRQETFDSIVFPCYFTVLPKVAPPTTLTSCDTAEQSHHIFLPDRHIPEE